MYWLLSAVVSKQYLKKALSSLFFYILVMKALSKEIINTTKTRPDADIFNRQCNKNRGLSVSQSFLAACLKYCVLSEEKSKGH